jgi:hypothetical protein
MRLPRIGAAIAATGLLLGCENQPTAVHDILEPSFGKAGGVTESVTGSAHYWWNGPQGTWEDTWRTFSFNARKYSDGSVEGRFQILGHGGRAQHKGTIICFSIKEKTAWLGAVIEKSNNPISVGGFRVFSVEDNGEGDNFPPDLASRFPPLRGFPTVEDFCRERPDMDLFQIDAGNIQVRQ